MEVLRGDTFSAVGRWARGLWMLLRFIPLSAWSISALLLGVGFAYKAGYLHPLHTLLMLAGVSLVQGLATHAYNDVADWKSGTDGASPRILSGGSHVIPSGHFTPRALGAVGAASLMAAVAIGVYFIFVVGPGMAVILAIGIVAGVFYTTPPIRLGYRPFVGEWGAALPALLAVTAGSFYILTGTITPVVVIAGGVHAILCIGRLMNHHIPDMDADAAAKPRKVTTVLWARDRWGEDHVPKVGASYSLLAAGLAAAGGLLSPSLLAAIPFAMGCAALQATVDPSDVTHVTRVELWTTLLIVVQAAAVVASFLSWG